MQQELREAFFGLVEPEAFAGSVVELCRDAVEVEVGVEAEVGALGEVLAQEAVGVLVAGALPRGVRVTEEDRDIGVDLDLLSLAQLDALVPGEGPAQGLWERLDLGSQRWRDLVGLVAVGEMHEHRVAGAALHQRADRGLVVLA